MIAAARYVCNGWKVAIGGGIFNVMRLILIVFVVAIEALIRLLLPRDNSHMRFAFEEPKYPGRPGSPSGTGVPAVPDRPFGMSDGAAASMQFDE